MSLLISFLYWNNRNPHLLWWETVEFHRCLRSEGESGKVQRGCLSETCWDAQRVTSAVQIDQNARPCQSWRARWFYDGVLTQWQFPWVWLANRNRVERALFRLQFPPKRLFRHFEPSIDIDYCARSRKRVFFFLGKYKLYSPCLNSELPAQGPPESSSGSSEKFVVVTWRETNVAIKVCLGSKTRWRTTLSKPTGHRFHHNASTKTSKDCCNRLQVCRWVKHTRSCTANVG